MANLEEKIQQDVKGIEDVLKAAGITQYSIFSFGSCNNSEFSRNSDVDIGILLPLPEEKLETWKTSLPGSDVYISALGRKIPFIHWVYNIDNFLSERFDSPLPDDPSDFEKWGNLAKYARVRYTAKTFRHLGGRSIESSLKKYANKHVPPEEGLELFTICTRDLAKGIYECQDSKLAKSILRAVDALHIAAGYNSLDYYAEMLAAGKRLIPRQAKLLEQAYRVKVKNAAFSRDSSFMREVEDFFKIVKSTINKFAVEADYQLDYKRVNKLARWIFDSTAGGIVDLLAKNIDRDEYLPFAKFYTEELISIARKEKIVLSSMPPNHRLLLERINKKLGDGLQDKLIRADIALLTKTSENAREIIDSIELAGVKPEERIDIENIAARIDIANSNYIAAAGHYETALQLRPWNQELAWELKEVYTKAGEKNRAEAFKIISDIIEFSEAPKSGKSAYEFSEFPEEVKTWFNWLGENLKHKLKSDLENADEATGAAAAKSDLESNLLNMQQALLRGLKSEQQSMLDKISNFSLQEDIVPLYRAHIRNKRLVQPDLYEIDMVREELYA